MIASKLWQNYIFLLAYIVLVILASAALCMVIGSFGAVWQIKLKRLLAFSAIGHVGYMLLVFRVVVQLDISLNYIEVAAIGLLNLILCSELAPID